MTFPPDATHTPGPPDAPLIAQPGVVIAGRYELIARVGDGGHGTVWRARDQLLRREVAIKEIILPPNLPPAERQQLCDRTLREAQATASLSHASVVRVFDVVTENGLPWIVMELLQARSLAEIIATDGPLPPRVVAKIGLALVGALEAAHEANILHRDIKPGNVLISSDGRCVLSDFGAAAAGAAGTGHTTPGMVLGSAHYIAPERAVGGPAVPASDLFSLGVTLYAAVEGRPPFDRADTTATMNAVVHEPPEAPRRAGAVAPLLAGLLEKDPARRSDLAATRNTLTGLLSGPLSADHPVSGGPISGIPGGAPISAAPASPGPADPTALIPSSPAPTGFGQQTPPPPNGQFGAPGQHTDPGFGPPPGYGPPGPQQFGPPGPDAGYGQQPPAPPVKKTGSDRPKAPLLLGAGIGVVVIALLVTVGVMLFGGGGDGPPPENTGTEKSADADPGFETETYTDSKGRFSVDVPKGWQASPESPDKINVVSPDNDDVWIRFEVSGASDPKAFLEHAADGLKGGYFTKEGYERSRSEAVTLAGTEGWLVEYSGVRASDKQPRHGVWAVATIGDTNYQIYLSVPEDTFADNQAVFEQALASYTLL